MVALRLGGRQISNRQRLHTYFNPLEIMAQRQSFAAFARAHLNLSGACRYHLAMLDAALAMLDEETPPAEGDISPAADYWDNPLQLLPADNAAQASLAASKQEELTALTERLYHQVMQTEQNVTKKRGLYYFLAAAYLLAGTAYNGETALAKGLDDVLLGRNVASDDPEPAVTWLDFPEGEAELELVARLGVYRLLLYTEAAMAKEERIRSMRITARRARSQKRNLNVELCLYVSEDEEPQTSLTLQPDEFIYVNVIGNRVTKILDTNVSNDGCSLTRPDLSKERLELILPQGHSRSLTAANCKETSCFAVQGDGYLLVQNYHLNTLRYPGRAYYAQLAALEYRRIVEVKIIAGDYLILQDNGRVYSSRSEWDGLRELPTLDRVMPGQLKIKG